MQVSNHCRCGNCQITRRRKNVLNVVKTHRERLGPTDAEKVGRKGELKILISQSGFEIR